MYSDYRQDTPIPRRHSMWDVTLAPKWRHRSHSLGLVNVSGYSPGLSQMMSTSTSQRTPATPCFVSPRMAFSTQFAFDSPIQILTSSSPGSLAPRSVSKLRGRCSLKRLSRRWKIVLIMFFTAVGTGLFIGRKMREITSMNTRLCQDGEHGCETDHETEHVHPGLAERFMDIVSIDKVHEHFHALARGLRRNLEERLEEQEQQEQGDPTGGDPQTEEQDSQTLEETLFDTGTGAQVSEEPEPEQEQEQEQEQERKERDDEQALGIPARHPRGIGEQTASGKSDAEGGRKVVDSEYQEDGEAAPPLGQRTSHLAPQRRQPEVSYRRAGSPPKKIVAQNRVQGQPPPSAWSRQQNQRPQQNPGQRRNGAHRGPRPAPEDGRRGAQANRAVRTPPGVNPRRYDF